MVSDRCIGIGQCALGDFLSDCEEPQWDERRPFWSPDRARIGTLSVVRIGLDVGHTIHPGVRTLGPLCDAHGLLHDAAGMDCRERDRCAVLRRHDPAGDRVGDHSCFAKWFSDEPDHRLHATFRRDSLPSLSDTLDGGGCDTRTHRRDGPDGTDPHRLCGSAFGKGRFGAMDRRGFLDNDCIDVLCFSGFVAGLLRKAHAIRCADLWHVLYHSSVVLVVDPGDFVHPLECDGGCGRDERPRLGQRDVRTGVLDQPFDPRIPLFRHIVRIDESIPAARDGVAGGGDLFPGTCLRVVVGVVFARLAFHDDDRLARERGTHMELDHWRRDDFGRQRGRSLSRATPEGYFGRFPYNRLRYCVKMMNMTAMIMAAIMNQMANPDAIASCFRAS